MSGEESKRHVGQHVLRGEVAATSDMRSKSGEPRLGLSGEQQDFAQDWQIRGRERILVGRLDE